MPRFPATSLAQLCIQQVLLGLHAQLLLLVNMALGQTYSYHPYKKLAAYMRRGGLIECESENYLPLDVPKITRMSSRRFRLFVR